MTAEAEKGIVMSALRVAGIVLVATFVAVVGWASPIGFTITLDSASPYYQPARASVLAGSRIVWVNPTASYHTITSDGCVEGSWCAFNSGSVPPNGRYAIDHLPPGEYPYHCELHPIMRGILVVMPPTAGSSES
jgi:plastocyanin